MMKYTEEQLNIINSKAKKIVVLSCAGSGKTSVIIGRILRIIANGVDSSSILALTFSNKAAQEMKTRIRNSISDSNITIKTFHAFGLSLIKAYSDLIGFNDKIKIIGKNESDSILKNLYSEDETTSVYGEDLLIYIHKKKAFYPQKPNQVFDAVFEKYQIYLRDNNYVDMDDMIFLPVQLLSKNNALRSVIQTKYSHIFVDEYQDTNEAQNQLLELITNNNTNICLVGDDDQSIYEWRGATPHYIRDKANSNEYETMLLTKNFRSQGSIIDVANDIISKNNNRIKKSIVANCKNQYKPSYKLCASAKNEATYVANTIRSLLDADKYNPSEIAVLYSKNDQAKELKDALDAEHILYRVKDSDANHKYTKFLRVLKAINSYDSTFELGEAINFPTKCFDKRSFAQAKKVYMDKYGSKEYDQMQWINALYLSDIDFANSDLFRERYSLISQLHIKKEWPATKTIAVILKYLEGNGYKEQNYEDYQYVVQTFDMARNFEDVYGQKPLNEFLDHFIISTENNDENLSDDKDAINLLTMHSSKGLEFKVVFIIGIQAGVFPNEYFINSINDLEAYRRTFYVALTRAKELLFLSSYRDPFGADGTNPFVTHGFLAEISDDHYTREQFDIDDINNLSEKAIISDDRISPEEVIRQIDEDIKQVVDSNNADVEDDEISNIDCFECLTTELIENNVMECYKLSLDIIPPKDKFIVIVGALEMRSEIMYGIMKTSGFSKDRIKYYDYNAKGFNVKNLLFNGRCMGIILGPTAHKVNDNDNNSLNSELMLDGYPYYINLINKKITKNTLMEAITKIKWNLCNSQIRNA